MFIIMKNNTISVCLFSSWSFTFTFISKNTSIPSELTFSKVSYFKYMYI